MHLSNYVKSYPAKDHPDRFLLYSTLRGSLVQVPGATLRSARSGAPLGSEGETLLRLGMLVEDLQAEREQMRAMLERANARTRTFRPIVMLNLDCNLNCGYCYEGEYRDQQYMSRETAQLLVETLVRDQISQGRDLSLAFYGGEPLLSLDLIRYISEPLREAARKHRVSYSFNLVTNGTLLNRRTAQDLVPLGLKSAKFTLDGPREIHNAERPYASGAGSFDAILDNIEAIWDLVAIQLGGNFRRENYRHFPRLLEQLLDNGITPEKLAQVQFTPVTPKAGCGDCGSGCTSSTEPWLMEALLHLRGEILARGFATSRPTVSACIVELEHNVVVHCNGSLYKCPGFVGWDGLSIGSLAGGMADFRDSHGLGNWQNDDCLDCPYLPMCFGGCRFLSLLRGKSLHEVDCRREFLDDTLEQYLLQDQAYPPPRRQAAPTPSAPAPA